MTLDELIDLARTCRHGEFSALASQSDILAVLTEVRDALSRRPAATSEAVSGDYVLVPRERTLAMHAGAQSTTGALLTLGHTADIWAAMLAAAPASPDRQTRDGVLDEAAQIEAHTAGWAAYLEDQKNPGLGLVPDPQDSIAAAMTSAIRSYLAAIKPTLPAVEKEQDGWQDVASKPGWALMPIPAMQWLMGEGPDPAGFGFGDFPEDHPKPPGAFWWRKVFRDIVDHYRRIDAPPPKSAVEIVRDRAKVAAKHGSHEFAAYLNSMADNGEEAAQREIDATLALGRSVVEGIERTPPTQSGDAK